MRDVLGLEELLAPHGVDFDAIRKQIKKKRPDDLVLVNLQAAIKFKPVVVDSLSIPSKGTTVVDTIDVKNNATTIIPNAINK